MWRNTSTIGTMGPCRRASTSRRLPGLCKSRKRIPFRLFFWSNHFFASEYATSTKSYAVLRRSSPACFANARVQDQEQSTLPAIHISLFEAKFKAKNWNPIKFALSFFDGKNSLHFVHQKFSSSYAHFIFRFCLIGCFGLSVGKL